MSSNIIGGGAVFKETPKISNNVVAQTIDTINEQLNNNNVENANLKVDIDAFKEAFIIDRVNKTITINPEYKLIIPGSMEQGQ